MNQHLAGSFERLKRRFVWRTSWNWALLGPVMALLAMHKGFSLSRIFYKRDLTFAFWPMHLWVRHELLRGCYPLWDPYTAFGQSAISDPVRGLLSPLWLPLRLLFPVVLGFNLMVVLPFPIAALGMFVYLRRWVTLPSAAFGSMLFVLSGPYLSTGNMINFSWSFALVPWIFHLVDLLAERPSARRFSILAVLFGLQFLAAESVTVLATAVYAVVYSAVLPALSLRLRRRLVIALVVVFAGFAGGLLCAVQAFPFLDAARHSFRAEGVSRQGLLFWSVHPMSLFGLAIPEPFGSATEPFGNISLWLKAFNGGREPLVFSLYLGMGALTFGVLGAVATLRENLTRFWIGVAVVTLVVALGSSTPIYPLLLDSVPLFSVIRYPSKLVVFVAFAVAILAAFGWDVFTGVQSKYKQRAVRAALTLAFIAASCGLVGGIWATLDYQAAMNTFSRMASSFGIAEAAQAGKALATQLLRVGPRLAAMSIGVGIVILACASGARTGLRWLLYATIVVDLLVSGVGLNDTADASLFGPPDWVASVRAHPEDRMYVAGRLLSRTAGVRDIDQPSPDKAASVTGRPASVDQGIGSTFLVTYPAGALVRDSFSYDNILLFPKEYWIVLREFRDADLEHRRVFLSRAGVRYFLVPQRDWTDATVLRDFPEMEPLYLYERAPELERVTVVPEAHVEADPVAAAGRMLSEDFDATNEVLLDRTESVLAGSAGAPGAPSAWFVDDGANSVTIRATAPSNGGYLLLLDTYCTDWVAEVDGSPATIHRADGLFRAIRLAPGSHLVHFEYRPKSLLLGAIVTLLAAIGLGWAYLKGQSRSGTWLASLTGG